MSISLTFEYKAASHGHHMSLDDVGAYIAGDGRRLVHRHIECHLRGTDFISQDAGVLAAVRYFSFVDYLADNIRFKANIDILPCIFST